MYSKQQIRELRTKREYGIGRMLLLARKDFVERLHASMSQRMEDLPPAAASLLPFLDLEGTRSVELAKRMGVSKQAVAKAVKELENSGLIRREADEADARAFRVQFSENGLRYMMKLHQAIDRVEEQYAKLLGQEELNALRAALCLMGYGKKLPKA